MGFTDWWRRTFGLDEDRSSRPGASPPTSNPSISDQRALASTRGVVENTSQARGAAGSQPALPQWSVPTANAPAAKPQHDPSTASRAMQQYLRSIGWSGSDGAEVVHPGFQHEKETTGWFGPHSYKLTPWQQEQVALNYGRSTPENRATFTGEKYKSGRLTQEAYDTLGEHQQRALRFNDLLLRAVQEDRRLRPSDEDRSEYDTTVAEMFGTQGGSDMYVPNTVRLLDNLGLELRGQDLDEYLSLERAYTDQEIASLQPWSDVPELKRTGKFVDDRSAATAGILDIQQIEAAGDLLSQASAWDEDSRIAAALGMPRPAVDEIPFGWLLPGETRGNDLDNQKEEYFQGMYNALTSKETQTLDNFWISTENMDFTDEDYEELFQYLYARSKDDDIRGVSDPQYRTGAELREFVGLGD